MKAELSEELLKELEIAGSSERFSAVVANPPYQKDNEGNKHQIYSYFYEVGEGLTGYESDWTDEDLKILFKDVLTDNDWEYIERTAIEADPVGMKKCE